MKTDVKEELFIYQEYNVRCFTSNPKSTTKSVPARMVNCLIKALNDMNEIELDANDNPKDNTKFLPRIIVIVPDWDIMKYLDHDSFGVEEVFGEPLTWMVEKMIEAIEDKKKAMYKLRPGSLTPGEPKFIWIKAIRRFIGYDRTMTVRNRFNKILEALLAKKKHHYIMDVDPKINNADYFLQTNQLNGEGRVRYWKEVNECLKLFEDDKLTLAPASDTERSDNRHQSSQQQNYKLPPLPPKRENNSASKDQRNYNRPQQHYDNRPRSHFDRRPRQHWR